MKIIEKYTPELIKKVEQKEMLSVAVAVYNSDAYLEKCIQSILDQTYQNLEVILIDDGSTDRCSQICDAYGKKDARVKVIHKQNGGLAAGRNTGIEMATGEFITFVDGDDWIDAAMYETMIQAIHYFNAELAVCRYREVHKKYRIDDSSDKVVLFEEGELLNCYLEEDDRYQIQNAAWNKLYRRSKIGKVRFPEGRWYEDILYTTQLFHQIDRSVYLDRAFYNYLCDREGSMMNQGVNPKIFSDQIPIYLEKTKFLKAIGKDALADMHNYYFYKRLLLLYTNTYRTKDKNREKYCKELEQIIKSEQANFERAFHCKVANPNEEKKMRIFLKSTRLYNIAMWMNDTFVIPVKTKRAAKRANRK